MSSWSIHQRHPSPHRHPHAHRPLVSSSHSLSRTALLRCTRIQCSSFSTRKRVFRRGLSRGDSTAVDESSKGGPTLTGSFLGTVFNYGDSHRKFVEATGDTSIRTTKMDLSKRGGIGWGIGASSPNLANLLKQESISEDAVFEASAPAAGSQGDAETGSLGVGAVSTASSGAVKGFDSVANLSDPSVDPDDITSALPPEKFAMGPLFACRYEWPPWRWGSDSELGFRDCMRLGLKSKLRQSWE